MSSCDTGIYELEFRWTIKKFSLQVHCSEKEPNDKLTLKSSTFSVGDASNETNWHLEMNIPGPGHEDRGFIGLFLVSESTDKLQQICAEQQYFIFDYTSTKVAFRSPTKHKFKAGASTWGLDRFYGIEKLMQNKNMYLPIDNLSIACRITVTGLPDPTEIMDPHASSFVNHSLSDDLRMLCLNERFSDVVFVLDGNERIPAHKIILVTRSAVFACMFVGKMDEYEDVPIRNVDPDIFREILQFIYIDKVTDIKRRTMELMRAAVQYGVKKLQQMCMEYFYKVITVDNAMELLVLAQHHYNQELSEYIQKFICIQC